MTNSRYSHLSPIPTTQQEIEKEILSAIPLHYKHKAETKTQEETTDETTQD